MPKENVYRSVFVTQLNPSFFVPKKDQCMVCSKYQSGTAEKKEAAELDFVEHLHQKRYCSSCEESEYSLIRLLSLQLLTCKVFFSCRLVQKACCTTKENEWSITRLYTKQQHQTKATVTSGLKMLGKEDQLKSDLCSLNIVQILCLENLSRPKNIRKVALTCWFSQCYNTRILNAKLLLYYFTYLLVCFWDTVYMLQHQQSMLLFWLFDTPRSIYNCSFKYFTYRVA